MIGTVTRSAMPRRSRIESLVKHYFLKGYPNRIILMQLGLLNGISISLRQLKRILNRLGLRRRAPISRSYLRDVETLIRGELEGSSILLGYRALWRRLRHKYRIPISRNTVMDLLRFITPGETRRRQQKRLRRRTFHIRGPNEVWSTDGYDKLKHFGFAIHGCIDAYSRRVLWLKVCSTNSNPKVIAWYYFKCVERIKGAPKLLCSDLGTENSTIAIVQPFLRGGVTSFRYVKSVSNQRIEAFWSILRRWCTDWWINFFHSMQHDVLYEECNIIHSDSLRFCFMHIIQKYGIPKRTKLYTHMDNVLTN